MIARREVAYFRFDTDRTGNVGRAIAQMALLDLGAAASALMGEGVGTFVAIDEFGALEAPALERLFARGRAAGFSVAVGTQTLADLRAAGPAVRERIGATVSAIVCHRIGEQADAEWVAQLIGAVPTWQTTIRTDGLGAAAPPRAPAPAATASRSIPPSCSASTPARPTSPASTATARPAPGASGSCRPGSAPRRPRRAGPPGADPAFQSPTGADGAQPKETAQMNAVTLIGNLTKDPEMRGEGETRSASCASPSTAPAKDEPLYINVAAFGRQAESCARYLAKGRAVAVSGRLRFREWEGRDGAKRSRALDRRRPSRLPRSRPRRRPARPIDRCRAAPDRDIFGPV